MNVLLSNDDGVFAPGLMAMYTAMTQAGHTVTVVAPDTERSGSSSALTITRPLQIRTMPNGFKAVNGTPADCVYLACFGGLDDDFDLVISGINSGANLGDDILYSGTVGAAREARHMTMPALAVSLAGPKVRKYTDPEHYAHAANWIAKFVDKGLPQMGDHQILNINIPDTAPNQAAVTRMGVRKPANPVLAGEDPRGQPVYWIGLAGSEVKSLVKDQQLMSDFEAVEQGLISVTPIQTDVTAYDRAVKLTHHLDAMGLN